MKVLTAIVIILFNLWFWYCVFYDRFPLFQHADGITKYGLMAVVIAIDIYFIADGISKAKE